MSEKRLTPRDIKAMKNCGKLITMLTAHDSIMASLIDRAGIDIILVSDAVGILGLGRSSALSVTIEEMALHAQAVFSGSKRALIVCSMPFGSYSTIEEGIKNATYLIKAGNAQAVHIEGGSDYAPLISALSAAGIPVFAHVGLSKVVIARTGHATVQGRNAEQAAEVLRDALAVQKAGAFATMLECVPDLVGGLVTEMLRIPVIGIGSGIHCDGQALVTHDMLGLYPMHARFVKKYADVSQTMESAFKAFGRDVQERRFPGREHSYKIKEEEFSRLVGVLKAGVPNSASG